MKNITKLQENDISEDTKKSFTFKLKTEENVEGKEVYFYDENGKIFDLTKVKKNIFIIKNNLKEDNFYFIDLKKTE